MTINPFNLLGVDPHKTSLQELKKQYYTLALLVHPDKNREKDGEEMHVLHMAYRYCLEQIENAESRKTTYEDLEKEFEDFCRAQEQTVSVAVNITDNDTVVLGINVSVPTFRDIIDDAFEQKKFNEAFETADGYHASFQGGYGSHMEASEFASAQPLTDISYAGDKNLLQLKDDFSSLIVYKEPISMTKEADYYNYCTKEPIDSYTIYMKNTCLTDYKEAHLNNEEVTRETTTLINELGMKDYKVEHVIYDMHKASLTDKTYEEILKEREDMDEYQRLTPLLKNPSLTTFFQS
jgi:hypothetical protein